VLNWVINKHNPIIIPEINSSDGICDYLYQTSRVLSGKKFPTYVFFVNYPKKIYQKPFVKIKPYLSHIYSWQIIPFNRFKSVQRLNLYLSFNLLYIYVFIRHLKQPIFWFFYPQIVDLLHYSLPPKTLLYDIVDSYSCPVSQKKELLQKANIVTAISRNLISEYTKFSPDTIVKLVPQGFHLIKSPTTFTPIKKLRHLTHKVGFVGGLNNRFDYDLLFSIIQNNPKLNFIFAGPESHDTNVSPKPVEKLNHQLFSYPNVYNLGLVGKNQVQSVISFFDIAIIPYDTRDQFNRLCYPMKIFEYFACQKPTISTPIEELKQFPNLVKIGNTPKEWQKHLNHFFSHPLSSIQKKAAVKLADKNSWDNKISQILKLFTN
jgi:hypothetical protein